MAQLIRVITVGRTRRGPLLTLEEDYLVRIARWTPLRREIAPASSLARPAERRRKEGEALRGLLGDQGVHVALDQRGLQATSQQFADLLARWRGRGETTFCVGGPDGLDESVLDACQEVLALSALTLPHELALALLLEQIYRALAAQENHPYSLH